VEPSGLRLFNILFAMGKIWIYILIVAKRATKSSFYTIHSSTETPIPDVIVGLIFPIEKKVFRNQTADSAVHKLAKFEGLLKQPAIF
jgi:hypothetical protein